MKRIVPLRFCSMFSPAWPILTMVIAGVVGLVVPVTPGSCQEPAYGRTLTLDSRYLVETYSNRAIGRFGIELLNLSTVPADLIGSGGVWRNLGRGAAIIVSSTIVAEKFSVPFHEYGHGTRAAAFGLRPLYGIGIIQTEEDVEAALASGDLSGTFFGYFLNYFFEGGSGYTVTRNDNRLFDMLAAVDEGGWSGLARAGGLNNEMYYTELMEDEMHRRSGHPGYLTSYLNGKLSANQYLGNDRSNVIAFYNSRGYSIGGSDIDNASFRSLALSSASYQLVLETLRMFFGKPLRYRPWSIQGIELPNLSFYMTRSGLSHRIRTGYHTDTWRFPLAVEQVFSGDSRTEMSVGLERRLTVWEAALEATVGRQLGIELDVDYRLNPRFIASAGYVMYDERNLRGARHIPSLEGGARYHGVHVRVAVAY